MAYKDQTQCYRTFDGVRWPNWCDVMEDEQVKAVEDAKAAGKRIKLRKHPDGYYQAFMHPEDMAAE